MSEFTRCLRTGAAQMDLPMTDEAVERLEAHQRLLCKWAPKVNLTTVLDPRAMAERLYLDSMVVLAQLSSGVRLHDVGSGAGFPGLVLKALDPALQVTLTEARRKRVSFLRQAARDMGLSQGLHIRWGRVGWDSNEGDREQRPSKERWPEVISRAVFPAQEWIRAGLDLVSKEGRLWVMSGQPHGEEGGSADLGAGALPEGLVMEREIAYRLPFCGRNRWLVGLRRRDGPVLGEWFRSG